MCNNSPRNCLKLASRLGLPVTTSKQNLLANCTKNILNFELKEDGILHPCDRDDSVNRCERKEEYLSI